ncbi:MAG: DUF1565 domain-containing protein [Myxococcales bacterium]
MSISGADTNPGTSASPFRTITKGLSVSASGDTVYVLPNATAYSAGETFPLAVPAGVNLIGDEANRGSGATPTAIIGCGNVVSLGNAAVTLAAGSTLGGFAVTCNAGGGMVVLQGNGATLRNSNLINGTSIYGAYVAGGTSNQTIVLNSFGGPTTPNFGGVRFLSPATSGKFENNTALNNSFGVVLDATPLSLGDNLTPVVSVGNNYLSCNSQADMYLAATGIGGVNAQFNRWDHGPPTLLGTGFTSNTGIDLFYNGGGVTYGTANLVVPSPCP